MSKKFPAIKTAFSAIALTSAIATSAMASTPITMFTTSHGNSAAPIDKIAQLVKDNVYTNDYRAIKTQVIHNKSHAPSYVLMYLFSKKFHKVEVARININDKYQAIGNIQHNYQMTAQDMSQQPHLNKAACPDPTVQFIAFAPNAMQLEQDITKDVADHAEAAGLKTVRLLVEDATSQNYINYMSCPKVIGNFYDGDANPQIITTHDGVVSHTDFETTLKGAFRQHVTNFWLACEAFNDPMKSAVIDSAGAQKYAAGINDLLIGPSDRAAQCAMEGSIAGENITHAFNRCVKLDDDPATSQDQWGFGGTNDEVFGK